MTPASALASYRTTLSQVGESVIVRRYAGTGAARVASDLTTTARVMGYAPHEIIGNVRIGDRKVIALADSLSAVLPLRTSDKIVIRGTECDIQLVDDNTRRVAGTLIALEIQVRG